MPGTTAVQYENYFGKFGGRSRTRTYDPLIKSQLLYHLSYAPAFIKANGPAKGKANSRVYRGVGWACLGLVHMKTSSCGLPVSLRISSCQRFNKTLRRSGYLSFKTSMACMRSVRKERKSLRNSHQAMMMRWASK
jgi:hypothetical protein